MIASTMNDAFQRRCAACQPTDLDSYRAILDWGIRHQLFGEAEQLISVMKEIGLTQEEVAAANRRLDAARDQAARRLRQAALPDENQRTISANTSTPEVTVREIESALRKLPKGTMQNFNKLIQPELVKGCTAASCHSGKTAEFRFWRKPKGRAYPRRYSQSNLYAIIQNIDFDSPDKSLFLKKAGSAHGGAETPVFDPSGRDFQLLRYWVFSISHHPENFYLEPTPNVAVKQPPPEAKAVQETDAEVRQVANTQSVPTPPKSTELIAPDVTISSDPYDPDVFNRRFHPGRSAKKD